MPTTPQHTYLQVIPNAMQELRILTVDLDKLDTKWPWIELPILAWMVDLNDDPSEMIAGNPVSLIRLTDAPWCLYECKTGQCFSEPLDSGWVGPLSVHEARKELLRAARHWRR